MNKCICKICGHDEEKCEFDEVVRRAKELIGFKKQASTALLQMDLKISYSIAYNVMEILEQEGLVGPSDGANPRKVNISQNDEWEIIIPAKPKK